MSDEREWIDELYADGADDAPPPVLDAAILAAAREGASRPWYRNLRYLTTVATAASFVLAAMIVYYAPQSDEFATPAPAGNPAPERQERRAAADREAADLTADQVSLPASPRAVDAPASEPAPAKVETTVGAALEEKAAPVPAEPAASEAAKVAGRGLLTVDTARRLQQTLPAATQTANVAADASAEKETDVDSVLNTLTARCGPPPGTEQTRSLDADALGWYLTVTTEQAVTYYRCENASWKAFDAPVTETSEQQPDPDHDQ